MLRRCGPRRARGHAARAASAWEHRGGITTSPSDKHLPDAERGPVWASRARKLERAGEHSGGSRSRSKLLRLPHPTCTESGSRCGGEAVMADATSTSSPRGPAARQAAVVSCWLCGIASPEDQMMPDGGSACDDIRWYCRDTRACTERWTQARRQALAAGAAPPSNALPVPSTQTAKPATPGSAARRQSRKRGPRS